MDDVKRLIIESKWGVASYGIVGVWDVTSLSPERLATLRERNESELVYARDYDDLRAQLAAREAEIRRLAIELADGPDGTWLCETCGFTVQKMMLRASDMAVGIDTRPVEDICPNDGTSLRRKTWKEDAADANRVGLEQMKRAESAEAERDTLAARIEKAMTFLDPLRSFRLDVAISILRGTDVPDGGPR